jgi:hypothetical protein
MVDYAGNDFMARPSRHLSDTRPECTLNNISVVLCTLFKINNNNVGGESDWLLKKVDWLSAVKRKLFSCRLLEDGREAIFLSAVRGWREKLFSCRLLEDGERSFLSTVRGRPEKLFSCRLLEDGERSYFPVGC